MIVDYYLPATWTWTLCQGFAGYPARLYWHHTRIKIYPQRIINNIYSCIHRVMSNFVRYTVNISQTDRQGYGMATVHALHSVIVPPPTDQLIDPAMARA